MTYVSLAAPIGPWIEPTVILLGTLLIRLLFLPLRAVQSRALAYAAAAAGIAGITATACAFAFPTLFFVSPTTFAYLLAHPVKLSAVVGGTSLVAGLFSLTAAELYSSRTSASRWLSFPTGMLSAQMIRAQSNVRQALSLCYGLLTAAGIMAAEIALKIPLHCKILAARATKYFVLPAVSLDLLSAPLFLAVGYVTGHVIAAPLLVGVISKITILDNLMPLFIASTSADRLLAFCTGLVLYGALMSFARWPKQLLSALQKAPTISLAQKLQNLKAAFTKVSKPLLVQIVLLVFLSAVLGMLAQLSFLSMIYVAASTALWMQSVIILAGRTGIAPLGRFATFVMVPGLLLFGHTPVQASMIAFFVELAIGQVADLLFSRKMAHELGIQQGAIVRAQVLGLVVCAAVLGLVVWLLATSYGLGSSVLTAQKAYSRSLLISAFSFDLKALGCGLVYAWLLGRLGINGALALSGIVMPYDYSLLLIIGGYAARWTKNPERYHPFFSGIFAAASLIMVIRSFLH
jgi:hypothetical protein